MSEHVLDWIPAYHDGELTGALREQVEAHLVECRECRASLEELRSLSHLLKASPLPTPSETAEQFTARLARRLPRRSPPIWQSLLTLGLRYAPLALFAAWAFFQVVTWLAGGLLLVTTFSPAADRVLSALLGPATSVAGLAPLQLQLAGPLLGIPELSGLTSGMTWLDDLGWFYAVNIALLVGMAVLFSGWLATWWAFAGKQNKEIANGLRSNSTSRV